MNDIEQFLTSNRFFTTSQATHAGFSKNEIKNYDGVVILGTFPVRDRWGKTKLEKYFSYNPELDQMVKQANKIAKKGERNSLAVRILVDGIEKKIRDILGFTGESHEQKKEPIYINTDAERYSRYTARNITGGVAGNTDNDIRGGTAIDNVNSGGSGIETGNTINDGITK